LSYVFIRDRIPWALTKKSIVKSVARKYQPKTIKNAMAYAANAGITY
jgi:hypothetical protein